MGWFCAGEQDRRHGLGSALHFPIGGVDPPRLVSDATDGHAAKPEIVRSKPERVQIMKLTPQQFDQVRGALVGVVQGGNRQSV